MDEMLIDNPDKFFTKYTVRNKDELHERLWKGVTLENHTGGRRATSSIIEGLLSLCRKSKSTRLSKEPQCFITLTQQKTEPSLTSADDIQFYLDLHFAYGIKSFYTIMKHKLDHFTITGKPGGKEKYLRMEEDAFIDTVDGMIADGRKWQRRRWEDRPEVEFQEQNH